MAGSAGLRRFVRDAPGVAPPTAAAVPAPAAVPPAPAPAAPVSAQARAVTQAAPADMPEVMARLMAEASQASQAASQASGGPAAEKCELCATVVPDEHGHVADLENSSLICACRACYLLFTQGTAGRGRYLAVPDRYLSDPGRTLTPAQWDQLEIPVGLAFFLRSSAGDGVTGFYPSPAGATECILDLAAWERLTQEYPLLGAPAPDVEAALICRTDDGIEYFLVPIDACYELAGRMRLYWRGFDGGAEARASIADFLDKVRSQARPFRPAA